MKFDWIGASFEGFRVISRRPGIVMMWGLTLLAAAAAFFGLFFIASDAFEGLSELIIRSKVIAVVIAFPFLLFTVTMLSSAVYRLILHPELSRFFYIRIGRLELMLSVFFSAIFAYTCTLFFVADGSWGKWLIGMAIMAFASPHFCLVGVGMFLRKRFDPLAGWRAAKGHYWPLLGMNALALIQYAFLFWLVHSVWGGFVLANTDHFVNPLLAGPGFMVALTAIFSAIMVYYTMMLTILVAPAAAAYRILAVDTFD